MRGLPTISTAKAVAGDAGAAYPSSDNGLVKNVSPETKFERFGEVKTYQELGMEQGNLFVPLSTLAALGWRMMPNGC